MNLNVIANGSFDILIAFSRPVYYRSGDKWLTKLGYTWIRGMVGYGSGRAFILNHCQEITAKGPRSAPELAQEVTAIFLKASFVFLLNEWLYSGLYYRMNEPSKGCSTQAKSARGNSTGTLSMAGNYTQSESGTLTIQVARQSALTNWSWAGMRVWRVHCSCGDFKFSYGQTFPAAHDVTGSRPSGHRAPRF